MKKAIINLFAVSCLMLGAATTQAQSLRIPAASPAQMLKQSFGLGDISIEYSRPSVRNRVIFGELVPYGKIWRTGANSATKLTFSEDVTFGGQPLKAGTYALYTIPGKTSWTVMLYSDLSLGGNVSDYNKDKEVLRIEVAPKYMDHKVESFTINLDKVKATTATLELSWDYVRVPVKIATEIDGKVMKSIDAALAADTRPYYQSASYYYDNGKDLNKASEWIQKAVEQNPKAYWVRLLQAKIQLKQGNRKAAVATAEEVVRLATDAKNDDYVKMGRKFIAENK